VTLDPLGQPIAVGGSVVRPVPVRSDSDSTAGRSSRAIGRT
jgi:hypothetical protein